MRYCSIFSNKMSKCSYVWTTRDQSYGSHQNPLCKRNAALISTIGSTEKSDNKLDTHNFFKLISHLSFHTLTVKEKEK